MNRITAYLATHWRSIRKWTLIWIVSLIITVVYFGLVGDWELVEQNSVINGYVNIAPWIGAILTAAAYWGFKHSSQERDAK